MRGQQLKSKSGPSSLEKKPQAEAISTRPVDLPSPLTILQRNLGNEAMQRLSDSGVIQTKLAIRQPGDPYEQEADRVAEEVMRMPNSSVQVQRKCACGDTPGPDGECKQCREKRLGLQRSPAGSAPALAPPIVDAVLQSPGRPLDAQTRAFMEPRFGYSLADVRVHDDARAAESAWEVNALAYTVGTQVVFAAGAYSPSSSKGNRLLAHELSHVVQQSFGKLNRGGAPSHSDNRPIHCVNPVRSQAWQRQPILEQPPSRSTCGGISRQPGESARASLGIRVDTAIGNRQATALLARAPVSAAPAQMAAAPPLSDEEQVAKAKADLVELIVRAAARFVGGTQQVEGKHASAHIPGILTHRLINRGAMSHRLKQRLPTNPLRPLWEALYGDEAQAALDTIDRHSTVPGKGGKLVPNPAKATANRRDVMRAVLARLLPSSAEGAPVAVPATVLDEEQQAGEETKLLTGNLKRLVTDKWGSVRVAVLVQFGALEVGTHAAIQRANAYYGQLVRGTLLDHRSHTLVHPKLQQAFDRASDYLRRAMPALPEEEREAIRATIRTMWSTNIRPNSNAKHKLSDHSFGWAIDLDAKYNPNVGKSGSLDPVQAVTGQDPTAFRTSGKSAQEVMQVAERLRDISQSYTTLMASGGTLLPILTRIAADARRSASLPPLDAEALAGLMDAATRPQPGQRANALRALLWPEGAKTPREKPPAAIQSAIDSISAIGAEFRTSFVKEAIGGKRVNPAPEVKPGTVAAHGFMRLPPLLVAALAGSDAGDLRWLGTSSVHDYMHFELKDPPSLASRDEPAPDGIHATDQAAPGAAPASAPPVPSPPAPIEPAADRAPAPADRIVGPPGRREVVTPSGGRIPEW
jgi:hypothetical protein